VKIKPKTIVKKRANHADLYFLANNNLCDHVKQTPEYNNNNVFTKGTDQGSIVEIPCGGQIQNRNTDGDKLK